MKLIYWHTDTPRASYNLRRFSPLDSPFFIVLSGTWAVESPRLTCGMITGRYACSSELTSKLPLQPKPKLSALYVVFILLTGLATVVQYHFSETYFTKNVAYAKRCWETDNICSAFLAFILKGSSRRGLVSSVSAY